MFIYENSTSTAILCDSALYAVWLLAVTSFKPFNNQLDLYFVNFRSLRFAPNIRIHGIDWEMVEEILAMLLFALDTMV